MKIDGKTGLFALFGSPVAHSGSPSMYNYCFEKQGLNEVYLAFEVTKDKVGEVIHSAKRFGLKGFNLTMPCKTEAMKYLDDVSEAAKMIGAVNTVVNQGGRFIGHNTDGVGFVNNILAEGVDIEGKKALLFGLGGAGKAILVELLLRGIAEIIIVVRKKSIEKTFDFVKNLSDKYKERVSVYPLEEVDLVEKEKWCNILINATNVGMKPKEEECIIEDFSGFHEDLVVVDIVYHPVKTKLLERAESLGCKTIEGRGMLLYQGAEAFHLFTGKVMPIEEVKEKFFS